jgi:hypothetical protein
MVLVYMEIWRVAEKRQVPFDQRIVTKRKVTKVFENKKGPGLIRGPRCWWTNVYFDNFC